MKRDFFHPLKGETAGTSALILSGIAIFINTVAGFMFAGGLSEENPQLLGSAIIVIAFTSLLGVYAFAIAAYSLRKEGLNWKATLGAVIGGLFVVKLLQTIVEFYFA